MHKKCLLGAFPRCEVNGKLPATLTKTRDDETIRKTEFTPSPREGKTVTNQKMVTNKVKNQGSQTPLVKRRWPAANEREKGQKSRRKRISLHLVAQYNTLH